MNETRRNGTNYCIFGILIMQRNRLLQMCYRLSTLYTLQTVIHFMAKSFLQVKVNPAQSQSGNIEQHCIHIIQLANISGSSATGGYTGCLRQTVAQIYINSFYCFHP